VVEFAGLSSHHSAAREVGQDPHLCGPGDAPVLSEVLTDTQLIILSAASQRDDRGVELPANVKGEAARKVVDKLIRAGLVEEWWRAPRRR
jgi:hypothetical protein